MSQKQRRKIGPGVYASGPLGEIEMEPEVVRWRLQHGLPVPRAALQAFLDEENRAWADYRENEDRRWAARRGVL